MNICRRPALVAFAALLLLTMCIVAEASEVDDLLRTLETARDPRDRYYASNQLSYIGESAVGPLIQVLQRSPNERFRGDAAYTLYYMRKDLLLTVVDDLIKATEDPYWRVRANIARALGGLRSVSERVAPVLVRLLRDSDSRVRSAAATALGDLRGPSDATVLALTECLSDSDRDTRYAAVRALGEVKPQTSDAVNAVIGLLNDKSIWVRQQAATTLGLIGVGSMEAAEALRTAFHTERDRVRSYKEAAETDPSLMPYEAERSISDIISALGRLGEPAAGALAEVARDPDYGESAIRELGDLGATAVPYLADLVRDLDGEARELVVTEMLRIYPPPVREFIELSKDPRPGVRAQAARGLGGVRRYAPEVLEVLVGLLDDDHETVRANAVASLGGLYDTGVPDFVLESLTKSIGDESELVRLECARSISSLAISTPALRTSLFMLARDPNADIRRVSHQGIGSLLSFADRIELPPEAVELVVEGLSDPDSQVRQISVRNVSVGAGHAMYNGMVIFDISVVGPKLTALLHDPSLVEEAADTLAQFGHAARPALPTLWELYFKPGETKLAFAIAQIGGKEVVGRLREALRSNNRDVLYKAVQLAHSLGSDARDAAPELEHIRQNDPDFALRMLAEAALVMVLQ
jgi:HEAT repeat protein